MKVELKDALEFLYADSQGSKRPCRALTLDVARSGIGSVQVLLTGLTKGRTVRLAVRRGKKAVGNHAWFRLAAVPVEKNTGPVGFTEKRGEINHYAVRRAPFWVYDAMEPIGRAVRAASPLLALRLHLPVSAQAKPARRSYTVEIQHQGTRQTLSLVLNVRRAVIPAIGKKSFPYTNWFSFNLMATRHGLRPWSRAHWRMIRRYARLMVHGRQNTFWVPLADVFTLKRKVPVLDRARLRRIVRVFTAAGMHYIEGGHVAGRTGGAWEAATFDIGLTGARATSVKGNADLACIAGQLKDEIERNRWQDRWLQHVTDEPTKANAADYRILTGMVRRHLPGLPILDATMDPGLAGSVDIWCPQVQEYQQHRREFEAQRASGDSVWFYTCCFPGGPWLNRLLDMELVRPALLGWGAARFGLEGFLHWGLNHYRQDQDPFTMSVVPNWGGGSNSLPAGDTHVVYPGKGRPWSSVRFEAQREGLEDYELLRVLQKGNRKQADRIIARVIRGFDNYTKNVPPFRAGRRALFDALDHR